MLVRESESFIPTHDIVCVHVQSLLCRQCVKMRWFLVLVLLSSLVSLSQGKKRRPAKEEDYDYDYYGDEDGGRKAGSAR